MQAILISFITFFSTFFGGLFALANKDRLHRILGYTAGVLLGVVAFDIFPEIFKLAQETKTEFMTPMLAFVAGFLIFHIAEKLTILHHAHEEEYGKHKHPRVGLLSAFALSAHSFIDGVGIGLAFQVNPTIGLAVTIAVVAHDFSDGLNTVSLMLAHGNSERRSLYLLLLDAAAPVAGAASTLLFHLSGRGLLLYLGFFAGFLMYIGASDILPEAHSQHSSRLTIALTILGVATMYVVSHFAL
jgi:zinc transporter ZupT